MTRRRLLSSPLRFRAWTVPVTTAISFGAIGIIYGWVSWIEPHHPKSSEGSTLSAIPAQMSGIGAQTPEGGSLQQNVSASQATRILELVTKDDFIGFNQAVLSVRPGEIVSLTLRNLSEPKYHYQHNWVLIQPGGEREAMSEAFRSGSEGSWTPVGPGILVRSHLLKPGDSQTLIFRAPTEAGDYPFLCTFPGHGNIEKGILSVK